MYPFRSAYLCADGRVTYIAAERRQREIPYATGHSVTPEHEDFGMDMNMFEIIAIRFYNRCAIDRFHRLEPHEAG